MFCGGVLGGGELCKREEEEDAEEEREWGQ